MGRFCILCCLLCFNLVSNLSAQIFLPNDEQFAFQVKQIDEFFERFNGDLSTPLSQYVQKHYPNVEISRTSLLSTLFNWNDQTWDSLLVLQFIQEVSNENNPVSISYYDSDWYAEVFCSVYYLEEFQTMKLVMQVETEADLASKWVIRSIDAPFLHPELEKSPQGFLNPVSHGTDFMNLDKLFSEKRFMGGYVSREFEMDPMTLFIQYLAAGSISFDQVTHIVYHVLQIPDWSFSIRQYHRDNPNSGWLISSLNPMTNEEKELYRKQILHLK